MTSYGVIKSRAHHFPVRSRHSERLSLAFDHDAICQCLEDPPCFPLCHIGAHEPLFSEVSETESDRAVHFLSLWFLVFVSTSYTPHWACYFILL